MSASSSGAATAGALAVAKIREALGELGKLTVAITQFDKKTSVQSCAATAQVILDTISQAPLTMGRTTVTVQPSGLFACFQRPYSMPMSVEAMLEEMEFLLRRQIVLYVGIANDHHFCIFPVDDQNVSILQGFQGSYTLVDWFAYRGDGLLSKKDLFANLTKLFSGNAKDWIDAALTLFAYRLASVQPSFAARVEQEMREGFGGAPYVKSYGYKPL